MKTKYLSVIILALTILPGLSFALKSNPSGTDDTIPAHIRYDKYYYTKWFDECPNIRPNGEVVDNCLCKYPEYWNFYADHSVAKWEHTNHRMRVKGLVAMVDRYTSPTAADFLNLVVNNL